jgi:transcriptional regulator with XRE-family HTH domain
MSAAAPSFSRLVSDAMARRGLGLRELCRRAEVDPSFLSKVLAGKRNPPTDEDVLRRVAGALELDAVEVIVSAGLIPTDWRALWSDPGLVRAVHAVATGGRSPRRAETPAPARPVAARQTRSLSEELL